MLKVTFGILVFCAYLFSAQGPATPNPIGVSSNQAFSGVSSDFKVLGNFEVRPSYKSNLGEFHSEDSALLGYQFNKNNNVVYKQEFNTNLYDPKLSQASSGLNAYLVDGYLRERLNNIVSMGNFSLSYEGRQYLPTWSVRREAGMITALRNYAKVKYQATPQFAVIAEEIPVIHFYNQAGSLTSKGPAANPVFENRATLGLEYLVSDKLKLSLPVFISDVRTRSYRSDASNNAKWIHKVWINPELFYSVNANLTLGMGYYSENLIKNNNFSETAISTGFEQGTTQLILSTNL